MPSSCNDASLDYIVYYVKQSLFFLLPSVAGLYQLHKVVTFQKVFYFVSLTRQPQEAVVGGCAKCNPPKFYQIAAT